MKILILGAGGIGGYFGGRLLQAGADVTFLVREARQQQLRSQGLRIESKFGDAKLAVDARLKDQIGSDFDLVILTCKAYDLRDALDTVEPALQGDALVLPLLNGIAHLEMLNAHLGAHRVLGGAAKIAVTLTPEGVVRHLNDWCQLTFGGQDGWSSRCLNDLKTLFDASSVEARISPDIVRELWLKLVHLGTVASLTTLMRANVGEIVRTPEGKALFREALETNNEIARREGYPPDGEFIASYHSLFSQADSLYEASLQRDLERGGRIESDHILGFLLERCRAHGLRDDILRLAYTHAKAYEQRRAAGRLPRQTGAATTTT
jgi:2-dehydropantoate 2-reductase